MKKATTERELLPNFTQSSRRLGFLQKCGVANENAIFCSRKRRYEQV